VHFLGSASVEGEGGRSVGSNAAGKFPNRRARWWDHSPGGSWIDGATDDAPTRYKYDCGGKHHSSTGFVTMDTLTTKYHEAVERADTEILLP
jgi:hypothetical protein